MDDRRFLLPQIGGDKTVPEFRAPGGKDLIEDVAHDTFATDIYYTGNLIRGSLLKVGNAVIVAAD